MAGFQFKKNERLKSRKRIAAMFREGQSFSQYPLRVIWIPVEKKPESAPVQFAVSVAKKKFPKAAHRNRIRRMVRETWRLHKNALLEAAPGKESGLAAMLLYTGVEAMTFAKVDAAMRQLVRRLLKKWN